MKLLTATSRTQGERPSDFNWCIEGELVTTCIVICGRDEREGPDGGCGCGRAFGGLNSHRSTTTAAVRDIDGFTVDDLTLAVRSYREHSGWLALFDDPEAVIAAEVAEIVSLAEAYPPGTVLESRLGELATRAL